jgi:hypothetical protein
MLSFHYKVDFSSDVKSSHVIVHTKCCELLLHSKNVLIVDFFFLLPNCETIVMLK